MENHRPKPKLKSIWIHVKDDRARELLSEAIRLILSDQERGNVLRGVDNSMTRRLNEEAPVESKDINKKHIE